MKTEIWKPVVGWEGYYEVSNTGKVKRIATGRGSKKGRILRQAKRKCGHLSVGLYRRCQGHTYLVHRLVLEAFVGPCPEGMVACHYDGNPENNNVSNLRWDTQEGNMQDAVRHGTTNRDSRNPMASLVEADILRVFEMRASGMEHHEIAEAFGVEYGVVGSILSRKRWPYVEIPEDVLSKVESLQGHTRGERNHTAKLTEANVLEIYRMRKEGKTGREIAEAFGVSEPNVFTITNGYSWRHLYHHFTHGNGTHETELEAHDTQDTTPHAARTS